MARLRSGSDLIDDALVRADVESATDRHPRPRVLRWLNQGKTELVDIIIEAYGRSFFRSATPWSITTVANTNSYTAGFPGDFYELLSVRVSDSAGRQAEPLELASPQEEPWLLEPDAGGWPTHYDLRPGGIMIYPVHDAGLKVTVEYIAVPPDLTDAVDSTINGYNGWEEYIVEYAAKEIATKDDEPTVIAQCEKEMQMLRARILKQAKNRDRFRPRRVQDVRGPKLGMARGRWWRR